MTGVLKGNGTSISAATAGTDYQAPITLTTTGTSGAATFISNALNIPQYQGAGNYITSLTGDITASGPGAAVTTLATVNSNVGSFTNANITVNAKGLITAASNGSAGGVSSISGDGTFITNSASTGAVTLTLGNAAANTIWGNNTGSPAAAAYQTFFNLNSTTNGNNITSTSSTALTVGRQGATNPVLQIDASVASVATGILIKGAAAGGGISLTAISSASNEAISLVSKGNANSSLNASGSGSAVLSSFGNVSINCTNSGGSIVTNISGGNPLILSSGLAAVGGSLTTTGLITKYNNITTAGWGVPAIYGSGRSTAQTAAVASVAAYTVGAADGSFHISANVGVTASTTHSFSVTCTYTDETNTSRTLTLTFSQLTGTLLTVITNVQGVSAYEGVPLRIRCKASTSITIGTTGTFTSVTYNCEGSIIQIS